MSEGSIVVFGSASSLARRLMRALPAGTRAIAADGLGEGELRERLLAAQSVLNLTMGAPAVILRAAERLSAAVHASGTRAPVVHVSSMSVYGDEQGLVAETSPPTGTSDYATAQIAAEQSVRRIGRTVILRPGVEYGPDCEPWCGRMARWLLSRRIGELGAGGDGYCNLIFIDDLVAAVLGAAALPEAAGGTFNIAAPLAPTWNEYLVRFALALGAPPVRRMTQRRWKIETQLLATPLKILELTVGRAPPIARSLPAAIPPSFRRLCAQEILLDTSAARRRLGLSCRPLAEGLAAAAQAYRPSQR